MMPKEGTKVEDLLCPLCKKTLAERKPKNCSKNKCPNKPKKQKKKKDA